MRLTDKQVRAIAEPRIIEAPSWLIAKLCDDLLAARDIGRALMYDPDGFCRWCQTERGKGHKYYCKPADAMGKEE